MPFEVILPKVDMDMTHGTLATWHVAEGEFVEKGAPLFDIETDKAAMEVEAPASGRLQKVSAKPGDKVPVGTVVAWLFAEGEAPSSAVPPGWEHAHSPSPAEKAAEPAATVVGEAEPIEVILPKVDMDMSHGTLASWHVAEGERIEKGEALFDIETDKAAMEVEAPATGSLQYVSAEPGDRIPVGSVVAYIYPDGVPVGGRPQVRPLEKIEDNLRLQIAATQELEDRQSAHLAQIAVGEAVRDRTRATPAARAAARQAEIPIDEVIGTGPRGRIQRDDVLHLMDTRSAEVGPVGRSWTPEPGPLNVSRRRGEGTPIVLIHGFTADSQSWAPFEKALQLGNPLIRIDLPGHGRSPRRRIAGFADLAKMVVQAFDDATNGDGPVHVVGHSLGGAIAISLADIRSRRIASLSLLAPTGLGPEIDADALNGIAKATRTESLAPWLRRLTATPEGVSDDYARAAMKLRTDPQLRLCQAEMANQLFPDGVQSFDLRPAIGRLKAPTVIVWGRQDHILPYRHSLAVDGDFGIHLIKDAGHVPQIECPDRVARIIGRHVLAAGAPV